MKRLLLKQRIKINFFIPFIIIFLFTSCASVTINPSILSPSNVEIPKKLHRLNIGLAQSRITTLEAVSSIIKQDEMFTIWERELEANIFDSGDEPMGYIDYKVIFNEVVPTEKGKRYFLITNLTFWISSMVGYPIIEAEKIIEVEITIFNKKMKKINKYNIISKSEPGKLGLYDLYAVEAYDMIATVAVTKDIIQIFKSRLESDVESINKQLESSFLSN